MADRLAFDAWTHRTVVWLDADAGTARAHLGPAAGELRTDPAGGAVLSSGAEDLASMARLLACLPWRFTVREPAALVDALGRHVAALIDALARSQRHR